MIPYDLDHKSEYHAVVGLVDAYGPADVCFVGTSRTREAIVVPQVQHACDDTLAPSVTVANYACAGAAAAPSNAIATYLLKRGTPRLILYGISPRVLRGPGAINSRIAMFWDLSDWWKRFRGAPDEHLKFLPLVIRNEMAKHYLTLKYRRRPSALVGDITRAVAWSDSVSLSLSDVLRGAPSPCPMRGGLTRWQRFKADRSLVTHPVSEQRVRSYVNRLLSDGRYSMPQKTTELVGDTIRLCRENGVEIILFELPLSDILLKHLPRGVVSECRNRIQHLCDANKVQFVTLERLGLQFSDSDFAEQSHLNYNGASRLTRALLDHTILPTLRRPVAQALDR